MCFYMHYGNTQQWYRLSQNFVFSEASFALVLHKKNKHCTSFVGVMHVPPFSFLAVSADLCVFVQYRPISRPLSHGLGVEERGVWCACLLANEDSSLTLPSRNICSLLIGPRVQFLVHLFPNWWTLQIRSSLRSQ